MSVFLRASWSLHWSKCFHLGLNSLLLGSSGVFHWLQQEQRGTNPTRHNIKKIGSSSGWKPKAELMGKRLFIKNKWSFSLTHKRFSTSVGFSGYQVEPEAVVVIWVCSPAQWRDLLLRKCSPLKTLPLKVFPHEHWERKLPSAARCSKCLGRCVCRGRVLSLLFIQSINLATAGLQGKRIFPEELSPPWLL